MPNLTLYTTRGISCVVAKQKLDSMGIVYDEINVDDSVQARDFLESIERPIKTFPPPQFYVDNICVWENGFNEVNELTAEQIKERVEEINASIKQVR